MTTQTPTVVSESALSKLILKGDISSLTDTEKVQYYHSICERLGVDPLTKPFDYLVLNGKQVLYLNAGGAQQLSKVHSLSISLTDKQKLDDIYVVTARASIGERYTDSTGAVDIKGLYGNALANALMKAETKAKRRATISLLGLAMLDETEVETIPNAKTVEAKVEVLGENISAAGPQTTTLEESKSHQESASITEPSMDDWETLEKLVKDNHYPMTYYTMWREREMKKHTPTTVYENALIKFGQPNKTGIEKDEVIA